MKLIDRRREYYNRRNLYLASFKDKEIRRLKDETLKIRIIEGDLFQAKLKRKPR